MNSKVISDILKQMSLGEGRNESVFGSESQDGILLDFLKGFSFYVSSNEKYHYNDSYLNQKIQPFLNSLLVLKKRENEYREIADRLIDFYVPESTRAELWVLLLDDFFYLSPFNNEIDYVFDDGNELFKGITNGLIIQNEFQFSSFRRDRARIALLTSLNGGLLKAKREWHVDTRILTRGNNDE